MREQSKLVAKWHSFYFDTTHDEKGAWVRITETRPNGARSSILLDHEFADDFQRELLKAVSACGVAPDEAHSASAVRPQRSLQTAEKSGPRFSQSRAETHP